MLTAARAPIGVVVQQHAEDTATLRATRSFLVGAPHVKLHQLRRLDERIAAHLDGLAVAGDYGRRLAEAALANPGHGEAFAATVLAIEGRNAPALAKLLALAESLASVRRGLMSAFGWVSAHSLRGITKGLLDSPGPFARMVGVAACAMHRVDPGPVLTDAVLDADAALRARALRVAGEIGRLDLLPACRNALADEESEVRFHAARAALLLGCREAAPAALQTLALSPGPFRQAAIELLLKVVAPAQWRALLKALSQETTQLRLLVRSIGAAGDPHYVPWLLERMVDLKLTRLAGESFSRITGLDLAALDLERKPPEGLELGPNDDPNDANVALDEDDSLPWPDPGKVAAWWNANGASFAAGSRYFMGEAPNTAHCRAVLRRGFQRQRIAAAEYCLLNRPGTALFGVAAPAWRQERELAQLGV